ncbi:MAG: hypothetical protein ACOC4G_12665 [Bacillota bacterium]
MNLIGILRGVINKIDNYIDDENLDKLLEAWKKEKTISFKKIDEIQDQILNGSFDYNWWVKSF